LLYNESQNSGGSLPIYSRKDGIGQELLAVINGHDSFETFVGHERLRQNQTDLQASQTNLSHLKYILISPHLFVDTYYKR
jgi:hypothetical protein